MNLKALIDEYLIEIEVRRYTQKTIRGYRNNLNLFLCFCEDVLGVEGIDNLTMASVRQFTKYMTAKGRKGTYINGLLKTIKSFLNYCREEGYTDIQTSQNFKWCKEEKPVILSYTPADVRRMLQSCKGNDFVSIRDRAILTTLFETGIRCWELCCIKQEEIHSDFIIIKGKNHKQRAVPVTPFLQKELMRYQVARSNYFALKHTEEFYFLSFHGRQLTNSAVEHIVKRHGEGIEGVRVSPHTCRHFFAQQQIKMGTDLYTISRLLGHENIRITQTYLNSLRDEDVIQIAKQRSVLMNL